MIKWRPSNWKTLRAECHPLHCLAPDACIGCAYEKGADAIMESISKLTDQEWIDFCRIVKEV